MMTSCRGGSTSADHKLARLGGSVSCRIMRHETDFAGPPHSESNLNFTRHGQGPSWSVTMSREVDVGFDMDMVSGVHLPTFRRHARCSAGNLLSNTPSARRSLKDDP